MDYEGDTAERADAEESHIIDLVHAHLVAILEDPPPVGELAREGMLDKLEQLATKVADLERQAGQCGVRDDVNLTGRVRVDDVLRAEVLTCRGRMRCVVVGGA